MQKGFNFISAIITAAGRGERFSSIVNKLLVPLNGLLLIEHSIRKFNETPLINEIILVTTEEVKSIILKKSYQKLKKIVNGGSFREESVYNGLKNISEGANLVLIHDAARPLFPIELIESEINELSQGEIDGVIPVIPIYDAIKIVKEDGFIDFSEKNYSLFKKELKLTQTPQAYRVEILKEAFEKNIERLDNFRDETELILSFKKSAKIKTIRGSFSAYKLTEMDELKILKNSGLENIRTGLGYDFHPFSDNRALIIGGIEIPYYKGLIGDSDADVLVHSIVDAILGALGKGDIGLFFGVGTKEVMGIKSTELLSKLLEDISLPRFEIMNIDSTLVCKEPKISNYTERIIENLSRILKIAENKINIKATTDKSFDAAGSGLGIRAITVATLRVDY